MSVWVVESPGFESAAHDHTVCKKKYVVYKFVL